MHSPSRWLHARLSRIPACFASLRLSEVTLCVIVLFPFGKCKGVSTSCTDDISVGHVHFSIPGQASDVFGCGIRNDDGFTQTVRQRAAEEWSGPPRFRRRAGSANEKCYGVYSKEVLSVQIYLITVGSRFEDHGR
jgi:hypothetical protein